MSCIRTTFWSQLTRFSIDIDELFAGPSGTFVPPNIPDTQVKNELLSPSKPDRKLDVEDDKPVTDEKPDYENDPDFLPSKMPKSRPKPGRLISNEQPLQDFRRLVDGDGDVFRKAVSCIFWLRRLTSRSRTSALWSRRMSLRHSPTRPFPWHSSVSKRCVPRL